MASEDALADLDALLSDLERTQCELYEEEVLESSTAASASTATSNSTFDACIQQKQLHNHRPIVHGSAPSSPTTTVNSAQKTPGHPIPSRHQKSARGEEALLGNTNITTTAVVDQEDLEGSNMSAVANPVKQNINELDSLLQDLSNARFSEQHVEERSMSTTTKTTSSYMETRTEMSNQETSLVSMMNGSGPSVTSEKRSSQQQQSFTQETSSSTFGGPKMGRSPSPPARQYSTESREQRNLSSSSVSRYPASSATQELDDLMTSLNTLKVKEGPATEEPVSTTLDVMLGNLQEDMNKQGIKQTFLGVCAECEKPILSGESVQAFGKTFHPEHFTCTTCNMELGRKNFFERDGKPYCELDYHTLFSPRCAACDGPILDKCVSALDQAWHPEHFVCEECERPFGDDLYHEKEGKAFCSDCYNSAFAPKCGGCQLPITDNYISSLDRPWHPSCFVCRQCSQPFPDGNFFEHEGFPYCEYHYHEMRGAPCAGCGKPISGRCITAMFRKFHPEHFVCSFCLKQLNKGTFKENGDKPYCHGCFDRLFG